jgi:hypothetical protein
VVARAGGAEKLIENSSIEWQDSPNPAPGCPRASKLFAWFRGYFPLFEPADEIVLLWERELEDLTDAQLRRGLERTKASGMQYAPSLPKFRELCTAAETGSPRYLGGDPVNVTELRIRGLLPKPEKKVRDFSGLRKALR